MKTIINSVATMLIAFLFLSPVQAGVSLNAARIGGEDVSALADFYKSAFGLSEVNRLEFPGMLEIMLNWGDSAEAAKANRNAQVVIMHRQSDKIADPVPHLIFNVTDITTTVAAIKAAGGKMDGEPRQFGNTGITIGIGEDPAGNRFEMIQAPAH